MACVHIDGKTKSEIRRVIINAHATTDNLLLYLDNKPAK